MNVTKREIHHAGQFAYGPFLAGSFDELLDVHASSSPVAIESLLRRAHDVGRVLLQARAGAGKSHVLSLLAPLASARGARVLALDLRALPIPRGVVDVEELAALLLDASGTDHVELAQAQSVLVTIDGLNETSAVSATTVLDAISLLASRHPHLAAVVTDRLTRRELTEPERWQLAGLTPVDPSTVSELIGRTPSESELGLLTVPFYLDRAMGDEASNRTMRLRQFFATAGIEGRQLKLLSDTAWASLRERGDLLLRSGDLVSAVGTQGVTDMRAAGLVVGAGDQVRFAHQLFHDYLAALAVAQMGEWNDLTFEQLTLGGASSDPLVLLLELVGNVRADRLLRDLYDWNLYAAAFVLAEDTLGARAVRASTRKALLALLAEKRFDALVATVDRASDALRLNVDELAAQYLAARVFGDVVDIARAQTGSDPEYDMWFDVFEGADVAVAKRLLTDDDGMLGWTAANVIRRSVDPGDASWLAELTRSPNRVVRWRALHVLGALAGAGLDSLFACLESQEDALINVRYGALRSLVEQASHLDIDERAQVLGRLADDLAFVREQPKLLGELERAVLLTSPPQAWADSLTRVLEPLLASAKDETEYRRWSRLAERVRAVEKAA